jgi:hypothetical protein
MKLLNRYGLLACFVCAGIIVVLARLRMCVETEEAIIGALFLLVPAVLASSIIDWVVMDMRCKARRR